MHHPNKPKIKNNALNFDKIANAAKKPTSNQYHGFLLYRPSKVAQKALVQNKIKGASGVEMKPKPITGIIILNKSTDIKIRSLPPIKKPF